MRTHFRKSTFLLLIIFFYIAFPILGVAADLISDAEDCFIEKDYSCAFSKFKTEADKENPEAQYNIAIMYERGYGVEKSSDKALAWNIRAGKNNHVKAQLSVGLRYDIREDFDQAIEWLKLASENNEPLAQYLLARYYRYGRGTEKNIQKSVEWYLRSSEQEYTSAQFELAKMYEKGSEITQNMKSSIFWYGKACENGFQSGCYKYNKLEYQSLTSED